MAKKRSSRSKPFDLTVAPELGDKTLLCLFGFAFIIASLSNSYMLMQMARNFQDLGAAILNIKVSVPVDVPAEDQPQLSPFEEAMPLLARDTQDLIKKYDAQGTPTLVINCNKRRVGTYTLAENNGNFPVGSEMATMISSLCEIAGPESVFCKDVNQTVMAGVEAKLNETRSTLPPGTEPGIVIETTTDSPCGSAETVIIYAFYSPTCPYCASQEPILKALKDKYQDAVQVTTICTPIQGADDVALCKTSSYGMV